MHGEKGVSACRQDVKGAVVLDRPTSCPRRLTPAPDTRHLIFKRHDSAAGRVAVGRETACHVGWSRPTSLTLTVFQSGEWSAMSDQGWVAAGDVDAVSLGAVQLGDGGHRTHADADALVIGQRDDSREAAMILLRDYRDGRTKINGDAFPCRQVAAGRHGQRAAQIVMTLKQLPSIQLAAMDFQLDRRSPKTAGVRG